MFDYTAGGLIRIPGGGRETLLVSLRKNMNFTPKREINKEEFFARLRNDKGALGQAIRDGKWDLIRNALKRVKQAPEGLIVDAGSN